MADFIDVAKINELDDGQMKMAMVGGHEVLLAKVSGKYYATQNRCQHLGGNLSAGSLKETVITCPRHHSQYDLRDGHVIRWTDWTGIKGAAARIFKPPKPLKTYQVRVQGDKIQVAMG